MGNCQGSNYPANLANSNEVVLGKVDGVEQEEVRKMIDIIQQTEILTNSLMATEPCEDIQSLSVDTLSSSYAMNNNNNIISQSPKNNPVKNSRSKSIPLSCQNQNSLELMKPQQTTNRLPEKLLSTQELVQSDRKLFQMNRNRLMNCSPFPSPSSSNSKLFFLTFGDQGELQRDTKQRDIRVYGKNIEEYQGANIIGQNNLQNEQKLLTKAQGQGSKQIGEQEALKQEEDEIMESDGNYEGSDEEDVKIKEKLIDNLFSDRSGNLGNKNCWTVVEDSNESKNTKSDHVLVDNHSYSHFHKQGSLSRGNTQKTLQQQRSLNKSISSHSHKVEDLRDHLSNNIQLNSPSILVQGGLFQGDIFNKKRNGIGRQTFLDGTVFMGEWKDDKRCGKGIQIWPDNTLYEGQWENDYIQGIGKIEYNNRSYYIGEWKQNKFSGKGRFQHFSGSFYDGFWEADRQHGKGIEVQLFPHYSRYEGIFVDGKKTGKGRLIMGNNQSYKGDFLNNNVNGMGIYTWSNGIVYEGHWENNKMSGNGKMSWPSGVTYQGEFRNDQKQGLGLIEYLDGSKYIGHWNKDKQDGNGTFYFARNHAQVKAVWKQGKIIQVLGYFIPKSQNQQALQAVQSSPKNADTNQVLKSINMEMMSPEQPFRRMLSNESRTSSIAINATPTRAQKSNQKQKTIAFQHVVSLLQDKN